MKELDHDPSEIPGERYFRNVWKTSFKHVKVVRHNRLGVCNDCVRFDLKISEATSQEDKAEWTKLKRDHINKIYAGNNSTGMFRLVILQH